MHGARAFVSSIEYTWAEKRLHGKKKKADRFRLLFSGSQIDRVLRILGRKTKLACPSQRPTAYAELRNPSFCTLLRSFNSTTIATEFSFFPGFNYYSHETFMIFVVMARSSDLDRSLFSE